MPELPDVEGFRRVFDEHARGRRVRRVRVRDPQVVHEVSGRTFERHLRGMRFSKPRRHGKWLIAPLAGSDSSVLMHFGMTGSLRWVNPGEQDHRHDRVCFVLDEGEVRYRDMRKLTGLRLARSAEDTQRMLGNLGPDAEQVSRADFCARLGGSRRRVKAALLDQAVIAGLGNLLVDEILWRAKIHPRTSTADLTAAECGRVHAAMGRVLRQSIPTGRVPPRTSWLTGRRDEPAGSCPRCGTTLDRGRAGGRTTVWCSRCQPLTGS